MSDFLWTKEQSDAIRSTKDVLLQATAGTGKTQTIVGKIMWMLGLDPGSIRDQGKSIKLCSHPCGMQEIAAITFGKSGARDLKRKLRKQLSEHRQPEAKDLALRVDDAFVGTIHQFCAHILKENALQLRIDPYFHTPDGNSQLLQISQIIRDQIFEDLENQVGEVETLLQRFNIPDVVKLTLKMLEDIRWNQQRYLEQDSEIRAIPVPKEGSSSDEYLTRSLYILASAVCKTWENQLESNNEKDFDRLILETQSVLRNGSNQTILSKIRERYKILIIDEFQDTDSVQKDIAMAITEGVSNTQLFLVGDPQQSIYRFRRADITVWNEVEQKIRQHGDILCLTKNFRSDPQIIDAINQVCGPAMGQHAYNLRELDSEDSAVPYQPMDSFREASSNATVGKLVLEQKQADLRRREEGQIIGKKILELVKNENIDYKDIAILYRNRTGLDKVIQGLRRAGVPFQTSDLSSDECARTLAIADLLNFLRLLNDPSDDYRALGFLRSPFVGLRDEVITKIRMADFHKPLIEQAEMFLEKGDWPGYQGHPNLPDIERLGLKKGLEAFRLAQQSVGRISLPELLKRFIHQTGYQTHLALQDPQTSLEAEINTKSFLNIVEEQRQSNLSEFLSFWDALMANDQKITRILPSDPGSDFVQMRTIHDSKGLEWPVVFLIKTDSKCEQRTNDLIRSTRLSQPLVLLRKNSDQDPTSRGKRADDLAVLSQARTEAEEVRLLYVSMTRARDKLILTEWSPDDNPKTGKNSNKGFVHSHLKDSSAFKILDIEESDFQKTMQKPIPLDWMDQIEKTELPPIAKQVTVPYMQFTTSATEVITRERSELEWRHKYQYGVHRTPHLKGKRSGRISATLRGDLIHGILERIQEVDELTQVLDETLGAMDALGASERPRLSATYREALEEELRKVLMSPEWKWYVKGEHYRELPFVHLAEPKKWYVGAFDLYRPGSDDEDALVVDFKTHKLEKDEIQEVGETYLSQMRIYREAGGISKQTGVHLHFTVPNATWPKKNVGSTI